MTCFLITNITSVFLRFSHVSSSFFIEMCEACLPLYGHSFWDMRGVSMTYTYEAFFHMMLGMYPILRGFSEPFLLRMPARPNLPSTAPFFLSWHFFQNCSKVGLYITFSMDINIFEYIFLPGWGSFTLTSLANLWRVSIFFTEYLSRVEQTLLRFDHISISVFLYGRIPHEVYPICK